jgi:2,4-dienoyl-CoA reductase (NADPH2)
MAPEAARLERHQPFRFRAGGDLLRAAADLGIDLPFDPDVTPLLEPVTVGGVVLPNRLAIQPMEGCDAEPDGAPGELALRRYRRFAEGGSGLIWFEATAVTGAGRANAHQLALSGATAGAFAHLVFETRRAASERFGRGHRPFLVLQLTHSGRYSRPAPGDVPRIACPNPHLDPPGLAGPVWTDAELDEVAEAFLGACCLARDAGFDAVDIKACHGYLLNELLAARTRPGSRYGGAYEDRARLLLAIVREARGRVPGLRVAVRLNATDGVPFPYGFGVAPPDGSLSIDLDEPRRLVRDLRGAGVSLLNTTAGIPVHLPHVSRPFDRAPAGRLLPAEHPLAGVARLIGVAAALQREAGDCPVVGTGYSWLRQFWPHVGAAVVRRGMAQIVGIGRGAFAYPDAVADLLERGALDPRKCCLACSHCSDLMRAGQAAGCVVRDRRRYRPAASSTGGAR